MFVCTPSFIATRLLAKFSMSLLLMRQELQQLKKQRTQESKVLVVTRTQETRVTNNKLNLLLM
jgi:hypothetical protein